MMDLDFQFATSPIVISLTAAHGAIPILPMRSSPQRGTSFCCHHKLQSTCYQCRQRNSISHTRQPRHNSIATSSCFPEDYDGVVTRWSNHALHSSPFPNNRSTRCNSTSVVECGETFRDDEEEWQAEETRFTDRGATKRQDWLIVTKGAPLPLDFSPSNNYAPLQEAQHQVRAGSSTAVGDHQLPLLNAECYARQFSPSAKSTRNALAIWTLFIVLGVLILGNLFGLGLETGAALSTLFIYLFKNYALRFQPLAILRR